MNHKILIKYKENESQKITWKIILKTARMKMEQQTGL